MPARSRVRDERKTSAPSPAINAAARIPTGPVPPRTTAFFPLTSPVETIFLTAATAVVLQPLASSITETRIGPKKEPTAFFIIFSP